MAFSSGQCIITLKDLLNRVSEIDILIRYFNVKKLPCVINSPLREDKRPSFSIYLKDNKVRYLDFSTGEKGNLWNLLGELWHTDFYNTIVTIYKDFSLNNRTLFLQPKVKSKTTIVSYSETVIKCRVREWREYDLEYWRSFGIDKKWLEYAEIYPISHKIIIKDNKKYTFRADKYAYAYVEHKDNKTFIKIYQPMNKRGFKWTSNIDRSIWSLWTKIPKEADNLIISSSMKDCLNISCNLHIPAICLQGEGYIPKPHVMQDLKSRYKRIIVFYDNDHTNPNNPGRRDSIALASEYNLVRVEIPAEYEAKDPSDLFKKYGKEKYLEIMNNILKNVLWKSGK